VALTAAVVVGVQLVEQRPDLRSWKDETKEILFCTLWTLLSEEVAPTVESAPVDETGDEQF